MTLKHKKTAWTLFALLASSTSLTWGQTFQVSPSQPEAYQAFTITTSAVCPTTESLIDADVHLIEGVIISEYLVSPIDFICPSTDKTVNITGLPGGTYPVQTRGRNGEDVGTYRENMGSVTVTPPPPTQSVYAFYNTGMGHYFITANSAERGGILQGNAGAGWMIVDDGFKAWPADGPAPAAALPVCRFYSPLANSHFYTADASSCEYLKQHDWGWNYEGIAFRALTPTAGSCPSGTVPVWRLYNNRSAQGDSNHRYLTSQETYRHMMSNSWSGEGVEFCSPQ